jgi:hypothetical protein
MAARASPRAAGPARPVGMACPPPSRARNIRPVCSGQTASMVGRRSPAREKAEGVSASGWPVSAGLDRPFGERPASSTAASREPDCPCSVRCAAASPAGAEPLWSPGRLPPGGEASAVSSRPDPALAAPAPAGSSRPGCVLGAGRPAGSSRPGGGPASLAPGTDQSSATDPPDGSPGARRGVVGAGCVFMADDAGAASGAGSAPDVGRLVESAEAGRADNEGPAMPASGAAGRSSFGCTESIPPEGLSGGGPGEEARSVRAPPPAGSVAPGVVTSIGTGTRSAQAAASAGATPWAVSLRITCRRSMSSGV